ncbi:substrate-binding periplasmic protein [Stutzerimonas azotifigens]|uniref:substrate-binding periplasmic protein n=1 Tax=Stutzerimonas azotifigens TaxID=291995 RepID=UPI0003FA4A98|nr:transporter substrate-binding domain-containing protein [Stutzerimonas azotifigens]
MPARLIVWLLLCLSAGPALAGPIRVVTEATAYSYLENGQVAGPASEVVTATLQRAGLSDYRIGLYPWARAYDMALGEPDVLIYLIARTPEREALFKWVGELMRIDYHLYKLRERDDIAVGGLDDARPYRIGVLREDVRHRYLQAQAFGKLVVSAHNNENFRLLLNGQVDLVPMPERDVARLCRDNGIDPARLQKVLTLDIATGLYMAFSRQTDDDTVLRARVAFEQLQSEGLVLRAMGGTR